ncbi:MAG: helix-turn-helix transcriptional regulator [Deltaproteobacteria bacterium]|nr:helix-turn-helix transcriptional regulator [Deltaproteobacteria bacterium]
MIETHQCDGDQRYLVVAAGSAKEVMSSREREVLRAVARGAPNKVVASELGLPESTVSSCASSALEKLNLPDRPSLIQLAAAAAENGDSTAMQALDGDRVSLRLPVVSDDSASRLTPSECAVLKLALSGKSNNEIGCARGTSPRTVANQLAALGRKLGATSRVGLALRAIEADAMLAGVERNRMVAKGVGAV